MGKMKFSDFAILPKFDKTGVRRTQRTPLIGAIQTMSLSRTLLFVTAASVLVSCCGAQIIIEKPIPSRAQIDIDAGKNAGAPIPRTIFGSFLEPIGNSTYNGLWAELLVNPSLEENLWSATNLTALVHERPELKEASALALPLPWEPLDA
jgi:alpha-N-arabinofuranosidase